MEQNKELLVFSRARDKVLTKKTEIKFAYKVGNGLVYHIVIMPMTEYCIAESEGLGFESSWRTQICSLYWGSDMTNYIFL